MKILPFFFFLTTFRLAAQENLFPITENGKMGYINEQGKVVIEPKFRRAADFVDGLAWARLDGTYGFIDRTGNFVIPPKYDYCSDFSEGIALVYLDGKPQYINKKGEKAFEFGHRTGLSFENGRAMVLSEGGKAGYIGTDGKLIIDTVYKDLGEFVDGMTVVRGSGEKEYGVIDTTGKFLIPYGKFRSIAYQDHGYFQVTIDAKPEDSLQYYSYYYAICDRNGNLIFDLKDKNTYHLAYGSRDGMIFAFIHPPPFDINKSHIGFLNIKGEVVADDPDYDFGDHYYRENRVFITREDRRIIILDTQGKRVGDSTFHGYKDFGFKNGVAFVRDDHWKYGMIDTNGKYLITPQFEEIGEGGLIDNEYFFVIKKSWDQVNEDEIRLAGICKKNGTLILKPCMQWYSPVGFRNGLLSCVIDDKLSYINKQGAIIWQGEKEDGTKTGTNALNIDHMNRGYFYANSKSHKNDPGGHGRNGNDPKKVKGQFQLSEGVHVLVRPDVKTKWGKYEGMGAYVMNISRKDAEFNAQDGRLYMKVQAKDKNGEWKDIEYLPSSWCGNSYHTLTLEDYHYWEFSTPVYEGEFKTKLRIELQYLDPNDHPGKNQKQAQKTIKVYSNEYDGSVNPSQFWRKPGYTPGGLMDPYVD